MKIDKKVISDLTLCYCVAPLTYKGEQCFVVASEKEHPCLLFDRFGKQLDEIWTQPGGTMSAVQYPGADGTFIATHKFYSPNNSKEAKLVLCRPGDGGWTVDTIAELPYVHRFDILTRDGVNYLLACCLKSDHEYKDDWRFPGMTLACRLPSLEELVSGVQLELKPLKENMLKNHGYCRNIKDGIMTGIVTSDEGVFRFTPPTMGGGDWRIDRLISDPTSDSILIDLNGDGENELVTLSPFHGDTLSVYELRGGEYVKLWQYGKPIEFAHAICAGNICGENTAVIGHRKGERQLLALRCVGGKYTVEVLDSDVGPANAMHMKVDGGDVIVSANREINEVAYYTLSAE